MAWQLQELRRMGGAYVRVGRVRKYFLFTQKKKERIK